MQRPILSFSLKDNGTFTKDLFSEITICQKTSDQLKPTWHERPKNARYDRSQGTECLLLDNVQNSRLRGFLIFPKEISQTFFFQKLDSLDTLFSSQCQNKSNAKWNENNHRHHRVQHALSRTMKHTLWQECCSKTLSKWVFIAVTSACLTYFTHSFINTTFRRP